MDVAQAVEFIRTHHWAVLATRRGDGTPQMSPVLLGVDGEGRLIVSSRETAVKTRNLRRHPHAWVCAFTNRFFGEWCQVGGDAEIVSQPGAMDLLVEYYRLVAGEHPDWDDYRAAMRREQRCLIRITPTEAGPTISG